MRWFQRVCVARARCVHCQSELKRLQDQLASRMVEFDEAMTRRDTKGGSGIGDEEVRVVGTTWLWCCAAIDSR